jgi:hypothetical protein
MPQNGALLMNTVFEDSTPAEPDDVTDRVLQSGYASCLQRFEAEAATLGRGFRTALFVQQFKAGLLLKPERDSRRLQQ